MRRFRRRGRSSRSSKSLHEIPLTPMIDTALTLLIIFMVASPIMHNAIKVTLPDGQAQESEQVQKELIVYVDKDGVIYFNEKKTTLNELLVQLKDAITQDDQVVFVNGDTSTSYGSVIELVDKIKVVGGIKYVALATKQA